MGHLVIAVIGPPGAGKGVQSDRLAQRLDGIHLSSGEILRQAHDAKADAEMAEGELVDLPTFTRVVGPALAAASADKPLILDGFIRELEDEAWVEDQLAKTGRRLDHVLLINLKKADAIDRIRARGRADDNLEAFEERWREYEDDTVPVINTLRTHGRLLEIDGSGTLEQVEQRITEALQ